MDKLPKNWLNSEIKQVSKIIRGVSYSKDDAIQEPFNESCLILRGGNIQDGQIVEGKDNVYISNNLVKDEQFLRKSDVVIVGSTGSQKLIGKGATALKDEENVSFGAFMMLLRANDLLDKWYFSYFFQTGYYRDEIRRLAGGVNINNIRKEYLENLQFPLPPLAEQQRIVTKVDLLFGQLDIIKNSLKRVPELLKIFRQQVLTQAVTGKLTEEWRVGKKIKKNILLNTHKFEFAFKIEILPENWEVYPIGNVFSFQQGMQIAKSTRFTEPNKNTLPILRIKNYHDGFQTDVEYIEINDKSLIAEPEDIILTRTGESRGWVLSGFKGVFHNNTFRINFPKDKMENGYIKYYLSSNEVQNFIKVSSGRTGQPDLTHKSFGPCPILIPPLEEQQEIVRRVESLFAKADAIEKQYMVLKEKVDKLPQAILHKAFKGELTEQLDTDGDAAELLLQIQELKQTQHTKGKRIKNDKL